MTGAASTKSQPTVMADIKPLLIAGGLSTRMGTAKHLLPFTDSRPLYQHTLEHLHDTCPSAGTLYISLRDESQLPSLDLTSLTSTSTHIQPLFDEMTLSMGPAAGLLAAYAFAPTATWLVVGCDYPLLTTGALCQLLQEYVPPVTCFSNAQGYPEPLLGIWGPAALKKLKDNVAEGEFGPSTVVRSIARKVVRPKDERWVFGANTRAEWHAAMDMAMRAKR